MPAVVHVYFEFRSGKLFFGAFVFAVYCRDRPKRALDRPVAAAVLLV
jgi:hypothetical protein